MHTLKLYSQEVKFSIVSSNKRRNMSLVVTKQNGLQAKVPLNTSLQIIEKFIKNKEEWVINQLNEFDKMESFSAPKEFVSGERLPYIGRSYRLQVTKTDCKQTEFHFDRGKFIATIPNNKNSHFTEIKYKTMKWYHERALVKLKERIDFYSPKVGKAPTNVKVKEFKTKWGNCTDNGTIELNWRIIFAPMSIIDYVVVHELCHLVAMNHSKEFWSKLSAILVDYKERSEWLKNYGPTLQI